MEEVFFIFDGFNEWFLRFVEENGLKMFLVFFVLKFLIGDFLLGLIIIVIFWLMFLLLEISEMVIFDRYVELVCFKFEDLKICI